MVGRRRQHALNLPLTQSGNPRLAPFPTAARQGRSWAARNCCRPQVDAEAFAQAGQEFGFVVAPHGIVPDTRNQRQQVAGEPGAAVGRVGAHCLDFARPEEIHRRLRPLHHGAERGCAVLADQVVGVAIVRQAREAQRLSGRQKRQCAFCRAPGGALARLVAVETQHRLIDDSPERPQLVLPEGGAERCHGVRETRLGEGDHVHIAFDDHDLLRPPGGVSRLGEAVEHLALPEQRGLGRVEVFRLRISERAPAERYRKPPPVGDREHDAVAQRGDRRSRTFAEAQQPGLHQGFGFEAAALQRMHQRRRIGGCIAQPEAGDSGVVEPAAAQIVHRLPACGQAQLALIERRRRLDSLQQATAPAGLRRRLGVLARHFQPGRLGELLDGFRKGKPFQAHQEADDIAVLAAGKAMEKALVRYDGKGRRALLLEGREAHKFPPAPLQFHMPRDDIHQGNAFAKLFQEIGRESHPGRRACRQAASAALTVRLISPKSIWPA